MNYNATLYYPTIEFANKEWLWNACLLWDKVYRIVPEGYIPNDRDEIRTLIEDKSVIANIAPEKYATEIFEDFIKVMDKSKWAHCPRQIIWIIIMSNYMKEKQMFN